MRKFHAIALVAASAAFFAFGGGAMAQNVSGADPYQQGFAAGASAKERNSFNAFDSGYRAAQADQGAAVNQAAGALAYDNGYQAGMAQATDVFHLDVIIIVIIEVVFIHFTTCHVRSDIFLLNIQSLFYVLINLCNFWL